MKEYGKGEFLEKMEIKINLNQIKSSKSTEELLGFSIINIDKPSGPTSFGVDEFVKKKLGLKKMSHFGTLDPKVTGVLPVALNRACKLMEFFIHRDKEYVGIMKIHEDVSKKKIEDVIKEKFIGVITQLPPVKSRVKREEREREIKSFEILEDNGNGEFLFQTICQGGTYIRKLIHDLGEELKCGAHMLELRRVGAGIFSEEKIVSMYNFEKAVDEYDNGKGNDLKLREILIPGEIVSELYPVVFVKEKSVEKLFTGKPVFEEDIDEDIPQNEGYYCIFSGDKFIGVYKGVFENGIVLRAEFVLTPIK